MTNERARSSNSRRKRPDAISAQLCFAHPWRALWSAISSFQKEGILNFVITANTPGEDRQDIISIFKSDSREHMVMFNYGVLTAGFDATSYPLRYHRSPYDIASTLFANGGKSDARSQGWWQSQSRNIHCG